MSSTSRSSPHTPSRRSMASERPTRTPLPNGTNNETSNGFVPAAVESIEKPGEAVQVPSTAPLVDDNTVTNQNQNQDQDGHRSGANGNPHASDREDPTSPATANEFDASELPPFDWEDFRRRNFEDMTKIDQEENSISEDFDKLAQAFMYWCDSAANRDNERAAKRLCTRERYVRLAEEALEAKQQRYIQVVGAFKQALEMLRNGL